MQLENSTSPAIGASDRLNEAWEWRKDSMLVERRRKKRKKEGKKPWSRYLEDQGSRQERPVQIPLSQRCSLTLFTLAYPNSHSTIYMESILLAKSFSIHSIPTYVLYYYLYSHDQTHSWFSVTRCHRQVWFSWIVLMMGQLLTRPSSTKDQSYPIHTLRTDSLWPGRHKSLHSDSIFHCQLSIYDQRDPTHESASKTWLDSCATLWLASRRRCWRESLTLLHHHIIEYYVFANGPQLHARRNLCRK